MEKHKFGKDISLIYRYSQVYFDSHLKQYDLGSGQYIFLINLYGNNGINQEQLADIVKIDTATTARAIAKLVKANYVRKEVSEEDKRCFKLYTTEKAEDVKGVLLEILADWNKIMLEDFDEQEKKVLFKLIDKVGENILCYVK